MISTKLRKWGSSLGVIIPKNVVEDMRLAQNQEVLIDIESKTNVLKELFGSAKSKVKKPTEQILKEARKELGVD